MEKKNYNKLNIPDWVWWVGIIEDRGDLSYAGRYKVRIMGYHSANKETLPTKDLPFASVVNSPTNAATSGIMENPALHHKFVNTLDQIAPNARLFRKSGSWRTYHSDSILVWGENPDRRYILVALIDDANGEQIIRSLVKPVEKALKKPVL